MVSPRPRRLGSKALAVALAGVLHLGGITWASTPIEGPASAALNELIQEHLTDRRIPGASIAIIEAGHQVRTAAYGTAVLQHGVPARIDTVYEIGSLSKQFTAAAVLMLRDEGKLDLEDPIGRYVVSAPEAWSGITIRHLLTHTAGLIREGEEFASLRGQGRRHGSKEAMLESAMADGLQGDPGERFSYGNEGYFLATLVVERASGLSFRDFMRERIFEPLGMRQTLFQDELRIIPNEARHYSLEVGEWVNLRRDAIEEAAGGWGMRSSIPDLVRWDRALREVALLSAEAHREMFEPVTLDDGASFRYGLGWWLPERNGIAYQYHRGVTGSEILRIPSLDLTVIVLTNLGRSGSAGGNEADPWGLADAIAGLLIPEFVLEPGDLPLSGQELASLDDLGERSMQSAATETEAGDPSPGSESTLPRIGLVLSGGGALGAAHVGVLKVLEELRIPVHFVAGTSMGALVGGLYSTGVSPKELEGILEVTDWRDVLDDHPPRRHLPYRRKVDDQTFLAGFEAGFNNGSFQTPPGLISGQKIGFALLIMALRAAGVDDFDQLPIPFRAVATDLENGEMVVLGQGDLAQAMRASMSVPGIFSPIELDDRLLVDGGLVRNLPVDVALSMGADVIIAVDVGESLRSRDELTSITKVTGQMLGMQMRSGVDEQAAMADVLIRPDLDGYGNTQFDRSLEMVPLGESAARRELASLQRFSVSEAEYQDHISTIRRPRPLVDARVRSVQLTASSTADPHFVMRHMKTRPGDKLDVERIQQDLERLYETGDFERIDLRLTRADTEDSFDLNIEAIDKSWGPNYLRFGLNLFADFEGESSFDALASYTMTQLNRRRGELKIQAQVGENTSLLGELYQPFSMDQTWFAALSVQGATSTTLVPVEGGVLASYQVDLLGMGLDLGLQLGRFAELRLGLTRGMIDANPQGDPVSSGESGFLSATRSHYGGLTFTAIVDQFDNMNFPQDGYFAVADYFSARESMGSDVDYEHLVGFFGRAMTKGRHTLLLLSNLYSALGSTSPEIYSLGGLFKLSGVPADSITGQYGGNLSLLYLNRVAELPTGLGNGVYAGFSFEGGNLWDEKNQISFDDLRYAGSLFVGADTILGPLYLAKGFSEGDHAFYFFMGRTF